MSTANPNAPVGHQNRSVLAMLLAKEIDVPEAIERAEVALGQGLALIPGGQALINLFEDAAGAGQASEQTALTAFVKVAEAPMDAFLAAALPGTEGQTVEADANAVLDQAETQINAWVALQVATFKANLTKGGSAS
jgi:hypothetical protein